MSNEIQENKIMSFHEFKEMDIETACPNGYYRRSMNHSDQVIAYAKIDHLCPECKLPVDIEGNTLANGCEEADCACEECGFSPCTDLC